MYVPILKWKQGEQKACQGLADEIADGSFPLFEIPPRPVDPKSKAPNKTVGEYLDTVAKSIGASWRADRPFALDPTLLEDSLAGLRTGRAMENLFKSLRSLAYRPLAVARSDHRPSRLQSVKRIAKQSDDGAMIRCIWEDVSQDSMNRVLEYLLGELNLDRSMVDLLLDVRTVSAENAAELASSVGAALTVLTNPRDWRSITVAGAAFPRNLMGLKPGRRVIARLDWSLFQSLAGARARLGRPLWYGDYGIAHWELPDVDVTKMQMSANLRYTSGADWVVFRGKSVAAEGYGQYVDLCALLVADPVYCGQAYSMGDRNYLATIQTGKPGNASCWRRDATNHHITLTVNQLANLGAL